MPRDHDAPLLHRSFTIRNPRDVLLLHPATTALVLAFTTVAVVFTFWPQMLDHAPVSFERRGIVHHIWHYVLLTGSLLTLFGMFSAGARRLRVELVGLCVLVGALGVNLVAEVTYAAEVNQAASGLDVALRAAAILGLTVRTYIVATEPTVGLPTTGVE